MLVGRVVRVVAVGVRSMAPRRALAVAGRTVTTPSSVMSLACRGCVVRTALGASKPASSSAGFVGQHLRPLQQLQQRLFSSSSGGGDNIVQFKLADVGEGIAECEVLRWYVDVGQKISQFQKLCEVQSDKATVEITSRYDGIVKHLHYSVGDMARVGSPLVDIALDAESGDESDDDHAPRASVASTGASCAAAAAAAPGSASFGGGFDRHGKVLATPAVRRIAMENNVDLSLVTPTGKDGRITKQDILDFVSSGGRSNRIETAKEVVASVAKAQLRAPSAAPSAVAPPSAAPSIAAAPLPVPKILAGEDIEVPIRGIQKIMVKTMTAATAVPHFGYSDEIQIDKLMEAREQLKPIAESRGIRLSYMPLMLKALSVSLRAFPVLNSHTNADCTSYIQRARHNIGVAMDTPAGLLVPNIKDVQARTVFEIAQELNRLQALGREGKLSTDDLSGGTFTLSNIGVIGGTYASPVLFLPEVAIGALGKVQKLPRFNSDGQVEAVHIVNISWSADHRIIDGATMARFGNMWKNLLENPALLLAELR